MSGDDNSSVVHTTERKYRFFHAVAVLDVLSGEGTEITSHRIHPVSVTTLSLSVMYDGVMIYECMICIGLHCVQLMLLTHFIWVRTVVAYISRPYFGLVLLWFFFSDYTIHTYCTLVGQGETQLFQGRYSQKDTLFLNYNTKEKIKSEGLR